MRHGFRVTGPKGLSWIVVAALVAAAWALTGPARVVAASGAAACDARDAVVWLESRGDAGAGSVWYTLGVTNVSARRCTMRGYPGVSAVDLAGRQLGTVAGRNPRMAVRRVVLAPGASGRFLLQLNDPGFFPPSACPPTTAAGLRVHLPGARAASVVPVPFRACARGPGVFLHATAVGG